MKSLVTKPKYKKGNIFLWIGLWALNIFTKVYYRVGYDKKKAAEIRRIKGPVLVLSNHQSPMDFSVSTLPLFPRRVSFVAGNSVYINKSYGRLIRGFGNGIPKKQFSNDYETVKSIKKMIEAGVSVIIFPEGRFSMIGQTGRIGDTIGRLAKWLGVPVVTIRNNGVFLTRPRFLKGFHRGKIRTDLNIAATAEDCKNLSADEIYKKIFEGLDYNDYKYQRDNNIAFSAKKFGTATGYDEVIYKCPACGAEYEISVNGNLIACRACKNTVELTEYGKLIPLDGGVSFEIMEEWYAYQDGALKKEIDEAGDGYVMSEEVELFIVDLNTAGEIKKDDGRLILTKDGFEFSGEKENFKFPIPNPPAFSISPLFYFDVFIGDDLCRMYTKGKNKPGKFDAAAAILFDKYQTSKKRTKRAETDGQGGTV